MSDSRYISRLREVVGCGITRVSVPGFADALRLDKFLEDHDRLVALVQAAYFEGGHMNPPGVEEAEWQDSEARKALDGGI